LQIFQQQLEEENEHQFSVRFFPGETSVLKVAVVCVEQEKPTVSVTVVSSNPNVSGFMVTLVIIIGLIVLIGVLASVGFFFFKRRIAQGKGIPKPFVKYISLSTNATEDDQVEK